MANVRCPMCSKFNPPEAEVCAYCGARLKPLRRPGAEQPAQLPQPPADGIPNAAPSAGDVPDWLSGLRSDEPQSPIDMEAPVEADALEGDVPDWLSRIRSRTQSDVEIPPAEEAQPGDIPDWMSALAPTQPAPAEETGLPDWNADFTKAPSSSEPDAADDLNWLGALNLPTETPTEAPSWTDAQDEATQSFDLPDFLRQQDAPAPPPAESQPPASSGFGLTDFLRQQGEQYQPENEPEAPSSSGFGLTDFLRQQEESAPPPPVEPPSSSSEGFGLTDFLRNQGQDASNQPGQTPGLGDAPADDFAGIDFSSFLAEEPEQQPQPEPTPEELSGWLSNLETTPEEDVPPASGSDVPSWMRADIGGAELPTPTTPESDSGIPSWLSGDVDNAAPESPAPSASEAGMPSWLNSDFEAAAPEPPAQPATGSGLPSWLGGGFDSAVTGSEETPAAGAEETPSGIPDWFSAGASSQPDGFDWTGEQAEEQAASSLPSADEPTVPLPGWLAGFSAAEDAAASAAGGAGASTEGNADQPTAATAGEPEPFIDEEAPDWLRDFNGAAPAGEDVPPALIGFDEPAVPAETADSGQPFAVDLPDWLSEESAPGMEAQAEPESEAPAEQLAQADLPEWVKEMRPIEAAMVRDGLTPEEDDRVEKAGPLAGLRGVLPTEDLSAHYRKPPVYSVKLRVSEKQRGQAALLENIVNQESQPLLVQADRLQAVQIIPRILIALILIVALVIPRVIDLDPLGVPVLYPAEMLDMFQQIDQTSQETGAVLLAVDYEPGRAGEMQLAASPVLEHLMARGTRLVVVSTVPNGPALAQRLVAESARTYEARVQQPYDLDTQVVNLGYLPGGSISLLEFAQYPRRSAPADMRGSRAVWNDTFLQNITGLGDFAQVIVLTDSAETGRAWVEQVQPVMGSVPLFMVTSAQASPLLMPYLESGQITGLVSGVLGGAMYSRLIAQGGGYAEGYLASYQVGLLLGFGLILVGGLFSAGRRIFKRNAKEEA